MKSNLALTLLLACITLLSVGGVKAETIAVSVTMDNMAGDAVAARLEARSASLGRLSEAVDQLAGVSGTEQESEAVFSGLYSGSTAGTEHPVAYPKASVNIPPPLKSVPAAVDSDRSSSADTATEADAAEETPAESTSASRSAEGASGSSSNPYVLLFLLILVLLLI